MTIAPVRLTVPGNHLMPGLLGQQDEWLDAIERRFPDTDILVRGNEIVVSGDEADTVGRLFEEMITLLQKGHAIDGPSLGLSIDMVAADEKPSDVLTSDILKSSRGGRIRPKTAGQKRYIGPAGTGKSWLAVATAVQALQNKEVERIILTRPAVEAGERLGFLPGDLMAKIDPYLRPLYDALYDMVDLDGVERLQDRGVIEVAPLAFMRGRTLNNSFIILDEAQNTTPEQMKMFLTRIGFGSKVVVTGDATQIDVPDGRSGLNRLEPMLRNIDGLEFVLLGSRDVVRHSIVSAIVDAYDARDEQKRKQSGASKKQES